jgi:transcription termination/antitermination protein NusG
LTCNNNFIASQTAPAAVPQFQLSWFAVQTWPRYEKKVFEELQRKQVETFLPLLPTPRQWSDRRRTVQLPLFAGYVFVRTEPDVRARVPVLRINGVVGFVGASGSGSQIADAEIDAIQRVVSSRVAFNEHRYGDIGRRVRIRGGSLDGLEGILVARNDDLSLVVSVQIIQRSLAIRVAGYSVDFI